MAKKRQAGIEVDKRSFVDDKRVVDKGFHSDAYFIAADTRQETQATKIYPHDREVASPDKCDRVKQGAITTQANDRLGVSSNIF